ncbi:MAG: MarR family transcriptional regulator [Proteobacteria bacterium]|nr:MarR family transcriptional regulator [Pseudomonadota bacterium]MBU1612033.1 MarR family transcriptional regulator [Pseudomonadota bacterium]
MEFVYKQSPAYLVNVLSRLFNQSLSARLATHKTTPAQLPVLLSLWQKDGQTQSELCKRMRIEQPTLANTLSRMVRDKLIKKVPDTNDRRQINIFLTARGRDLKPVLTASALEVHKTAMRGITDSGLETMLLMFNKIISNLDADLDESPLVLDDAVLQPVTEVEPDVELQETSEETPDEPPLELLQKDKVDNDDALVLRDIDIVRD